jgi:HEAT repeat protein
MKRHVLLVSFVAWLAVAGGGLVYSQTTAEGEASIEKLWSDAVYYLKIGRMDAGKAYLQAFVDRKPDPIAVLELAEKDPSGEKVLIKLQSHKDLGNLASAALDLITQGWQQKREDPHRIAEELDQLGGSSKARFNALSRITESGEYAVPVIVKYLADPGKASIHGALIEALVKLGRTSIDPLVVALEHVDSPTRLLIIEAMAQLDYTQALPHLKALAQDTNQQPSVHERATRAAETIFQRNPKYRTDVGAGSMFYNLAMLYYIEDSAVRPPVAPPPVGGEIAAGEQPNIWLWRDGGLVNQPVPWEIYYKLMVMRMSRRAMQLDGSLQEALTLWLLANCQRELRLSEQVVDPIHGNNFPGMETFLRFAGTDTCLAVLHRALDGKDVAVASTVLRVLTQMAAGADILKSVDERQPIVDALNYPDQAVQLQAALTLAWAAPKESFPASGLVMPLLGKILTGPDKPLATLIISNEETSAPVKAIFEKLNYQVLSFPSYEAWLKGLAGQKERVEVIVVDYALATPSANQIVTQLDRDALLRLVPTMVLVTPEKEADATTTLAGHPQVVAVTLPVEEQGMAGQLAYLQRQLGRRIVESEDAQRMALSAANALVRLAALNLDNFKVSQVKSQLMEILTRPETTEADWTIAYTCGEVLARIPDAPAQQSLAQAALADRPEEQKIALLDLLLNSIRHAGNLLTPPQVGQLQQIVITGASEAIIEHTTEVLGALDLPSGQARELILSKETFGSGTE